MANTRLVASSPSRPDVTFATVLTGEIDPYWATLLDLTFNPSVDGAAVGLGGGRVRVDWHTMVPTLEPATNPRVNADGFLAAYAASASRTEWAYAAKDLADATRELPKRLAGKDRAMALPGRTGAIAELLGKGIDAPVMRNWLGWALGRFGTAAACLMPTGSLDVTLPRRLSVIDYGTSYDGFVELALAAWPTVMGAQPPAPLLRLMRGDHPTVGDVYESLAAVSAFGARIQARHQH